MDLYITRDSVAAGDDVDSPHERTAKVPDDAGVAQIVAACSAASSLPTIAGGQATWVLSSGVPLALIVQQSPSPILISPYAPNPKHLDQSGGTLRLHFAYLEQQSPDIVLAVLRRLKLYAE